MDTIIALKLLISTLLVLFLPGYFLYFLFLRNLKMDFFQGLIMSIGLSLSFVTLITYYFTLIGIKLNTTLILLIFCIFAAIILLKCLMDHKKNNVNFSNVGKFKNSFKKYELLYYFILGVILLISLLVRLIPVKDILVGPGADSYHHTLIVQLIIENGGIPHLMSRMNRLALLRITLVSIVLLHSFTGYQELMLQSSFCTPDRF